jgi:predicted Zn-dependent protease
MLSRMQEQNCVRVKRFIGYLAMVLAALSLAPSRVAAAGLAEIRDAEIENTIRTFATPIWLAAGLDPQAIHIYIVNDPQLNSFVAGGQNIFINTGMLLKSDKPNQIIGVIAHETGHVAGGHLARAEEAMHNATIESIIGMVIGAAAAVAARGSPDAAAAVGAGAFVGQRSWLSFSVAQEASADHAALTFLDRAHMSAKGLLEFFEILQQQELLSAAHQSPFLRDHPLTEQRVEYVRDHVAHSPWSNAVDPPEWMLMHQVMKAKLIAFLGSPAQALAQYPEENKSVPARYARAIAYYRVPELKKALEIVDGLIHDFPTNPYFQELKGQMLFENGRVIDAVKPYQEAVRLKPDIPLLRLELAQVELETNDPALVPQALAMLREVVRFEDRNPEAWRQLAIAYGRSQNEGMMALALAQEGMAEGDFTMARQQAGRAAQKLPPGPERLLAQDIAADAKRSR